MHLPHSPLSEIADEVLNMRFILRNQELKPYIWRRTVFPDQFPTVQGIHLNNMLHLHFALPTSINIQKMDSLNKGQFGISQSCKAAIFWQWLIERKNLRVFILFLFFLLRF